MLSLMDNIKTDLLQRVLFLDVSVKKKLFLVNIFTFLCRQHKKGSTDSSLTEKEVFYIVLTDSGTFKPTEIFFKLCISG